MRKQVKPDRLITVVKRHHEQSLYCDHRTGDERNPCVGHRDMTSTRAERHTGPCLQVHASKKDPAHGTGPFLCSVGKRVNSPFLLEIYLRCMVLSLRALRKVTIALTSLLSSSMSPTSSVFRLSETSGSGQFHSALFLVLWNWTISTRVAK